jgi:hypothetical protein
VRGLERLFGVQCPAAARTLRSGRHGR